MLLNKAQLLLVFIVDFAIAQEVFDQKKDPPKIQVALVLDTSTSMDGLLLQTRTEIWKLSNYLRQQRLHNVKPTIEFSILEYGNANLSKEKGYVRVVADFTTRLSSLAIDLQQLTPLGGEEWCGYALQTAIDSLQWSSKSNDVKMIFIAGNEPFNQGPINFREEALKAKEKGIVINTIFCGDYELGRKNFWKMGADLSGGSYANFNQNSKLEIPATPFDKSIDSLNQVWNTTVIPINPKDKDFKEFVTIEYSLNDFNNIETIINRLEYKFQNIELFSDWDQVSKCMSDFSVIKSAEIEQNIEKRHLINDLTENLIRSRIKFLNDVKKAKNNTIVERDLFEILTNISNETLTFFGY